jgi:hypothetical protein
MTRKKFCSSVASATVLLLIQACGGGGSGYSGSAPTSSPPPTSSGGGGCSDTIAGNHGHVLSVAAADLDSATDMSYDIQGTADHTHTVVLTVAQLRTLKTGASVNTTSSTTLSHMHDITITCI